MTSKYRELRAVSLQFALLSCVAATGCSGPGKSLHGQPEREGTAVVYPAARRVEVADDYFGIKVLDPYRWLEKQDDPDVLEWVKAQNRLSRKFLDTALRSKIMARLEQLADYPKYGLPAKRGGKYFFLLNKGMQNQPVLYVQAADELGDKKSEPVVLLDPNPLSPDGTTAVTGFAPSRDGKMVAYLLSQKGSDWQELKIRKVDDKKDLPETLRWCKFTSIAWLKDGSGFFYNRFPNPEGLKASQRNKFAKVFFHVPGTSQEKDVLVFERPDNGELGFEPFVTEDGKYLVLTEYEGTDPRTGIYVARLTDSSPGAWKIERLFDHGMAKFQFIGNKGDDFYFVTDLDADRGRLVKVNLAKALGLDSAQDEFVEVVPQSNDVLHYAAMAGDRLLAVYMHDAHHVMWTYDLEGRQGKEIPMPDVGSVFGISGRPGDDEAFFSFTSFLIPKSIYKLDVAASKAEMLMGPKPVIDPSLYETKEVFYESKDGTKVHMFLVHKKGLKLDHANPVLLYGYGGFDISLTPYFSVYRLPWLEAGGVFAMPNLRGGGEYGSKWHEAGMLEKKQNVFDDFMAAARWLVERGYTGKDRLAIMGGSNGGLLTAACMVQRPDLFGAVVSAVPVIDMLRYQKFSVGHFWIPEYGNAEHSKKEFEYLYAYSPLHNIREGVAYPPTLILTADHDDRVVPMHGKKFAAALQHADKGGGPILLYVETSAGHGRGKPMSKRLSEYADILSFLFRFLDVPSGL